ncbi:MAG: hypothetical protein JW820_16560, partial [Spirochaetales bacterium]|nr:hypothetical protein [Spirochaetales bacterium]
RHRMMRDVVFYTGREVRISSRTRVKMQMDGDKAPPAPATVWLEPRYLPVFVPRKGNRAPGAGFRQLARGVRSRARRVRD